MYDLLEGISVYGSDPVVLEVYVLQVGQLLQVCLSNDAQFVVRQVQLEQVGHVGEDVAQSPDAVVVEG